MDVDVDVDDKAEWSTRNKTAFIRLMHDHVKKGDLQTSTFTKKIWSSIGDELFNQTKKRFNIGQLKSKFNRLRKKHREFSNLIAHTGFGWDPISNIVTALETIWVDYIKVKTRCVIDFLVLVLGISFNAESAWSEVIP